MEHSPLTFQLNYLFAFTCNFLQAILIWLYLKFAENFQLQSKRENYVIWLHFRKCTRTLRGKCWVMKLWFISVLGHVIWDNNLKSFNVSAEWMSFWRMKKKVQVENLFGRRIRTVLSEKKNKNVAQRVIFCVLLCIYIHIYMYIFT